MVEASPTNAAAAPIGDTPPSSKAPPRLVRWFFGLRPPWQFGVFIAASLSILCTVSGFADGSVGASFGMGILLTAITALIAWGVDGVARSRPKKPTLRHEAAAPSPGTRSNARAAEGPAAARNAAGTSRPPQPAHLEALRSVDTLTGIQFEHALAGLFRDLGYQARVTPDSGDFGADLILERVGQRTVVQAKRYATTVGVGAIQESMPRARTTRPTTRWRSRAPASRRRL